MRYEESRDTDHNGDVEEMWREQFRGGPSVGDRPALSRGVLGAMLVGIIAIGVYPAPLVDAIDAATRVILP